MVRAGAAFAAAILMLAASACRAQSPYVPTERNAPGETVCGQPVCGADALYPAFERLEATERGEGRFRILQIGDSHTAGDQISGQVRGRMQARFGRGGRGVLPPGVPYAGYAPRQAQVEATGATYLPAPLIAGGTRVPMGLAGGQGRLEPGDDRLILTLDPGVPLDRVGVCGRAGPDRGTLWLIPDIGLAHPVVFRGEDTRPLCAEVAVSAAATSVTLIASDGPVVLDDVRLESASGLTLSNLGVVGSTLMDMAGRDEATARAQLGANPPDLILLAYGVNEGFDAGLDPAAYEQALRARIAWLRAVVPDAALMILLAPEGLRRRAPASGPERWSQSCGSAGEWQVPPTLALVRDVQRRVSEDLGVAFWDWYGRMGGACSADRLAGATDPLMRGDRVHFTAAGAEWIGDILADDLMATYDGWRAARTGGD